MKSKLLILGLVSWACSGTKGLKGVDSASKFTVLQKAAHAAEHLMAELKNEIKEMEEKEQAKIIDQLDVDAEWPFECKHVTMGSLFSFTCKEKRPDFAYPGTDRES